MELNKSHSTFILFLSALLLLSCNNDDRYSLKYISETFHVSQDEQLEYDTCVEQWTPMNGNGYRICIFNIKDQSLLTNYLDSSMLSIFTCDDYLLFENEIQPYIQNNTGFYHLSSIPLKSKDYIFIIPEKKQLIHFYIIM